MTATITTAAPADRYFVARSAGRYRVFETLTDGTEVELAVVSSRAKGEEKVAKLVAAADAALGAAYSAKVAAEDETRRQEATPFTAEENAALAAAEAAAQAAAQAAVDAEEAAREAAWEAEQAEETPADVEQCGIFGHEMADGACEVCGAPDPAAVPAEDGITTAVLVENINALDDFATIASRILRGEPTAPLAVVTADGTETTVEVTPTDVRAATDAAWTAALTAPPAPKPAAKRKAKAKAETEKMTSLWVARNMVDGLIARAADADPAVASIAAKVDASTPNSRGGRTIRLTEAELRALSGIATEVENAAIEAKDGTVAMSAQKLRGRLDGYLATY